MSPWFLKEIAAEIAVALIHQYNLSLQQGIVPRVWKQSHITLVYKVGSADDTSNYRMSVLSVVTKILEKIYGMIIRILFISFNSRYLSSYNIIILLIWPIAIYLVILKLAS